MKLVIFTLVLLTIASAGFIEEMEEKLSLPGRMGLTKEDTEYVTMSNGCKAPGYCERGYQACCWILAKKNMPCNCHLQDGTGQAGSDCGDCGFAFQGCCAGFAAKGFPCKCDVEE